jgi:hypothetical protein
MGREGVSRRRDVCVAAVQRAILFGCIGVKDGSVEKALRWIWTDAAAGGGISCGEERLLVDRESWN